MEITYEDFKKVIIKVGTILEAKVNAMQEYIEKTTGKTLKELYFEDF